MMLKWCQASYLYLTSISRTHWVSGNRSHTLLFIFSLMMKEWHVLQSPIFMALLAATTCSLMLSGGPEEDTEREVIHIPENKSWFVSPISLFFLSLTQQWLPLAHPQLVVELFADHPATGIKLVGRHIRDLQQHGWHQVHTLQELQINVHVERHLKDNMTNTEGLSSSKNENNHYVVTLICV